MRDRAVYLNQYRTGPPRDVAKDGANPRDAFGVVRLAICDQRVSPPLFESLEVLGQRTLARLKHFAEGARDRHV